jgi:hypothetical protein
VLRTTLRCLDDGQVQTPSLVLRHGDRRWPLGVAAGRLMRASTGWIARERSEGGRLLTGTGALRIEGDLSDDEPRRVLLGADEFVDPAVLHDDASRPCLSVDRLGSGVTVFTLAGESHTWQLRDDASPVPYVSWGAPVTGAAYVAGGLVAWNQFERRLMWIAGEAGPRQIDVPFRPLRPSAAADGSVLWCTMDEGLWRWRPGDAPRKLVETPPLIWCEAIGEGYRLHPATRVAEAPARRIRLARGWEWLPGTDALVPADLGRPGQATSSAADGTWTARAHPYADLIAIRHESGETRWLGCYFPLALAWRRGDLLVATGGGTLLRFGGIHERLGASPAMAARPTG